MPEREIDEKDVLTLICTRETFRPAPVGWVRWLALNADLYRVQQAMRTEGVPPPAYADWEEWHRQGYLFCAAMEKGRILAQAAVLKHSETDWELAGVRTLEAFRRKGYGKAVVTFATDYILSNQARATCHTERDNEAMLLLAQSVGYTPQS